MGDELIMTAEVVAACRTLTRSGSHRLHDDTYMGCMDASPFIAYCPLAPWPLQAGHGCHCLAVCRAGVQEDRPSFRSLEFEPHQRRRHCQDLLSKSVALRRQARRHGRYAWCNLGVELTQVSKSLEQLVPLCNWRQQSESL